MFSEKESKGDAGERLAASISGDRDQRLRLNPLLVWFPFDSDDSRQQFVCEVPIGKPATVRRFTVTSQLIALLETFRQGCTISAAAAALYRGAPQEVQRLERLVRGVLLPRGFLVPADVPNAWEHYEVRNDRNRYLQLRVPVFPARIVTPIARMLAAAYEPAVALPALIIIFVVHLFSYIVALPTASLEAATVAHQNGGSLFLLLVLAGLVHEFGHADAAFRFGCRKLEIGVGQYLHFTVFYTDLSEIWRLPRKQRMIVDLGGIYFQCLFASAWMLVFYLSNPQQSLAFLLVNDAAIFAAMNPFFRLDGYWVVTDLTGLANLRARSGDLLKRIWNPRNQETSGQLAPWPLSYRATVALTVYSLLLTGFVIYMVCVVLTNVGPALVHSYPETVGRFAKALTDPLRIGPMASAAFAVFWKSCVIYVICRFLFSVLRGLLVPVRDRFERLDLALGRAGTQRSSLRQEHVP